MKYLTVLFLVLLSSCGDPSDYVKYSQKEVEAEIVEEYPVWVDTLYYQLQTNEDHFQMNMYEVTCGNDLLFLVVAGDSLTTENSFKLILSGTEMLSPNEELVSFTGAYRGNHLFLFNTSSEIKILMRNNQIHGVSQRVLGTDETRIYLKSRNVYDAAYLSQDSSRKEISSN